MPHKDNVGLPDIARLVQFERSTMDKRRLDYLDLTKGIGIILVVIAHSTFTSYHVQTYIIAFHMPLFFIVSGMLLYHTGEERNPLGRAIKKKAATIMIPYVAFSIAYLIIDIAGMYLGLEALTWADIGNSALMFVTLRGISVLWFMPALFIGQLLFLGCKKLCSRWTHKNAAMVAAWILAAIGMTVGSTLFHTYYPQDGSMPILCAGYFLTVMLRSLGSFSFLTIGYYGYCCYFEKRDRAYAKVSKGWKGINWKETACGVLFLLLEAPLSRINGGVDMNNMVFANPVLYYLNAVMGTLGVLLVCRQIERCKPLRYLGVNSLIIMATHLDFQVMYFAHRFAYGVKNRITGPNEGLFYLSVAFAVTLMEIFLIYVINRWLPFMLGKKKNRIKSSLDI